MAEIEQEAADAGMTVEEYAAAGYEAPAAPEPEPAPEQEAPEPPTKEPAASDYYYSINEGAARDVYKRQERDIEKTKTKIAELQKQLRAMSTCCHGKRSNPPGSPRTRQFPFSPLHLSLIHI